MAATLAYLRACRSTGRRGRFGHLGLAGVLFVLSLLAKATALLWPAVLLVVDVYPLGRLGRATGGLLTREAGRRYLEKAPYALVALALAALAWQTKAAHDSMLPPTESAPLVALARAGYSAAFYLQATFLPGAISPFYERPAALDPLAAPFVLSAVVVGAITVVGLACRQRWPALLATWTAYGLLLAPSSGVVPYGSHLVAARYSYVACLPWAVLLGAAAPMLARSRRQRRLGRPVLCLAGLAGAAALAFLAVRSWELAHVWADSERLWQHTLTVTPGSALAHIELGLLAERRGDLDGAEPHFRRAAELWPGRIRHVGMAQAFEAEGNYPAAAAHYRRALRLYPDSRTIALALGRALHLARQPGEAAGVLREAAERFPDSVDAWVLLGVVLAEQGHVDAAISAFRAALALDARAAAAHHNLAVLLTRRGEHAEARPHLERALELAPALAGPRAPPERRPTDPRTGHDAPPAPR